jgi:hypothetical protein
MTQESYNNYLINLIELQGQLAAVVVDKVEKGSCNNCQHLTNLRIAHSFIDVLSCYALEKEEYSESVDFTTFVTAGDLYVAMPNIGFNIIPGDLATSSNLPDGTKVLNVTDTQIFFDHGFINSTNQFSITFSRTNDVVNCITKEQALGMVDVLNKIFSVNYCVDFILNDF